MPKPFKEAKENMKVAFKDFIESIDEEAAKFKKEGKDEVAMVIRVQAERLKKFLEILQ